MNNLRLKFYKEIEATEEPAYNKILLLSLQVFSSTAARASQTTHMAPNVDALPLGAEGLPAGFKAFSPSISFPAGLAAAGFAAVALGVAALRQRRTQQVT